MDMSKEDASNFVDFDRLEYAKLLSTGLANFPDLIQPLLAVGYFCCCTDDDLWSCETPSSFNLCGGVV
ncbi:hypothetical protein VNO80_08044 [Phaseolus coccineus]|uniref:Uncharacterized protein n=1 Tax=Phaseolus coccineus TaxID=3886 RepID=A0AAN9NJR5_PHACN